MTEEKIKAWHVQEINQKIICKAKSIPFFLACFFPLQQVESIPDVQKKKKMMRCSQYLLFK